MVGFGAAAAATAATLTHHPRVSVTGGADGAAMQSCKAVEAIFPSVVAVFLVVRGAPRPAVPGVVVSLPTASTGVLSALQSTFLVFLLGFLSVLLLDAVARAGAGPRTDSWEPYSRAEARLDGWLHDGGRCKTPGR